jgi:hypothetical protein
MTKAVPDTRLEEPRAVASEEVHAVMDADADWIWVSWSCLVVVAGACFGARWIGAGVTARNGGA